MIAYETLQSLEKTRHSDGIVSLYLRIDPRQTSRPDYLSSEFKELFTRFMDNKTMLERHRQALERERESIQRHLDRWTPRGRGLVIFTCQPAGLWETFEVEDPVPTLLAVEETPRIQVLQQLMKEYPRFVVVTVHRDQAAIYTSERRTADKRAEYESIVQGWHSQGGWSQSRFQRHIEYQVHEHLKKVVDDLERMYYTENFHHLAIGGPEPTVKDLIRMLPEPIIHRLIGTFPIDAKHDTEDAIMNKARDLMRQYEEESEKEMIDHLASEARDGGHGVIGLKETIPSIVQGRVQTLIVAEGASHKGAQCDRCDYFADEPFEHCPMCGGAGHPVEDIIDRAAEKAFLAGAHVETVMGEGRFWLLAKGGLGAILRY